MNLVFKKAYHAAAKNFICVRPLLLTLPFVKSFTKSVKNKRAGPKRWCRMLFLYFNGVYCKKK